MARKIKKKRQQGPGRPATTGADKSLYMRVDQETLDALDALSEHWDACGRSEAARRAIKAEARRHKLI